MFWFVLLVFTILFTSMVRWQNRKIHKLSKELKCDIKGAPILGFAYVGLGGGEARMKGFEIVGQEALKHGGIGVVWMVNRSALIIADPAVTEVILKNCVEKDYFITFIRDLFGNGTFIATAETWRPQRQALVPTFSPKNLNHFVDVFARHSAALVEKLQPTADGEAFPIWNYICSCTLDSVCETILGVRLDESNQSQKYLHAWEQYAKRALSRALLPWLHNDFIFNMLPISKELSKHKRVIFEFVDQIIQSKHTTMAGQTHSDDLHKSNKPKSILETLSQSTEGRQRCTNSEIRDEAVVLLVAGSDTSGVGLCFTLSMLARHPDVQDKVFEELSQVFGDSSRPVTCQDLNELKYLDAVVKETLRLYPPLPFTTRMADRDLTLPSGVKLVKGPTLAIHIWAIHRNPRYWGADAEVFRPERFLEPDTIKHPAQYMPFSYGPRNCLGYKYAMMSMKTVLATFLRHYRVLPPATRRTACNGHQKTRCDPMKLKFEVMLKAVDNFLLRLEKR